jgi:hypothetical protein
VRQVQPVIVNICVDVSSGTRPRRKPANIDDLHVNSTSDEM